MWTMKNSKARQPGDIAPKLVSILFRIIQGIFWESNKCKYLARLVEGNAVNILTQERWYQRIQITKKSALQQPPIHRSYTVDF